MRRLLRILAAFSFSAWAQPAQQRAQLPPVVKVEMPPTIPTNSLIRFLELILPAIIGTGLGAGLAFYSVSRTNKHNARENAANRQHQLYVEVAKAKIAAEYRSNDNRWDFQKTVYVDLVTDTTNLIRFYANITHIDEDARRENLEQFRTISDTLMTHLCHARLANADEAVDAVEKATKPLVGSAEAASLSTEALKLKIETYITLRNFLCVAGRKDLWGGSEPKAEVPKA